jgi:hypothetical protein
MVMLIVAIAVVESPVGRELFRSSEPEYSVETRFEVQMLPPDASDPDGGYYFEGHVRDTDGGGIANATVLVYRNMHPADEQMVLAPIPGSGVGPAFPARGDSGFGPTLIDTAQTDESGYYRASVDKFEKVEVVVAATGYHTTDTRILPALGVQQVDVTPISEDEPAPRPVENAPFVLPEGLRRS